MNIQNKLFGLATLAITLVVTPIVRGNTSQPLSKVSTEKKASPDNKTNKASSENKLSKTKKIGNTSTVKSAMPQSKKISVSSTVVIYQDSEKGLDPYVTRYIINKEFMRIDDGKPGTGFVLLDRKKDIIYSISIENESILVIKNTSKKITRPAALVSKVVMLKQPKGLKLEGKPAQEFEVRVAGKVCQSSITVKGALPDFVKALTQYRIILASQHASNLFKTPVNMRDNCFMAYHIFDHGLHTSRGLIVRSSNSKGKKSMLQDYKKNQKTSPTLFSLPQKYSKFNAGQVP
ncbi:hypothetical protein MNBD_GAMMA12-310 [hydrothermal vent metagenome]|uniref:DUF4412 domain-containing protein n=1 Tax=hydrothermal vent metagenome TaxID=652676 RepID=A0A3B0Y5L9_9ZZZZ